MATSRYLYLLRHAKSSWDDPQLPDHDRPLAPRGQRAVKLLAAHIVKHEIQPAQVLCSSARRTLETYEGVGPSGELLVEPELYDAGCDELLGRLRRVPRATPSVMLIGHNPGLQILAFRLAGAGDDEADGTQLGDLRRKFPTGALAILAIEGPWSELDAGGAELVDLVRPRDLK